MFGRAPNAYVLAKSNCFEGARLQPRQKQLDNEGGFSL
jgi:hypothetical protein